MKWVGLASAVGILLLGLLAAWRARTPGEAADALRALGVVLTLVTGLCSAMWWHQSASLSDPVAGGDVQRQKDAGVLNGAAATATGLALIGSVFSNLSWTSLEGALAGVAFLLLLAMSGSEVWVATILSIRQGLRPRSVLALLVVAVASLLFTVRRLVG